MADTPKTPADVTQLVQDHDIKIVDLKFTDLPGTFQHFSIPASELNDDLFDEGLGFDGSSIRGFQEIHESDMMLVLDAGTAFVDPVLEIPTLSLICDVRDPIGDGPYSRDPPIRRSQGRGIPEADRYRRHQLLGTGAGALHLRRHPIRPERELRLLLRRLRGRNLELGSGERLQSWAQTPPQAGILPRPACRHPPGCTV